MNRYTPWQLLGFTVLRVMIGWHFLYEGLLKLFDPGWTSKEFLLQSTGPFSSFFHLLGTNDNVIMLMDILNIAGLVLIGFSLFIGLFNRLSIIPGIILMLMYYFANPPFIAMAGTSLANGHFLIINYQLIEAAALCILILYPTSQLTGLAGLFKSKLFR